MGKGQYSRPSSACTSRTAASASVEVSSGDMDAGPGPVSYLGTSSKNAPPNLARRLLAYVVPKRFSQQQSPSTSSLPAPTPTSTSASTSSSTPATNSTEGGGGLMHPWFWSGDTGAFSAPSGGHAKLQFCNSNPGTSPT